MKQSLRNTIILFLLVAIMAPLSFAFLSYHLQLKIIKHSVKEALIAETAKSEFVAFSFDLRSPEFQKLRWEHGREFELDDKMYDIVEADTLGHIVHYLCFPDKQETALNFNFKKKLEDRYAKDQNSKNRANHMLSMIYGLYFVQNEEEQVIYTFLSMLRYAAYQKNITSLSFDFPTPPPQLFS